MRVGIIALQHESNTFIQTPTTLADFEQLLLASGEHVRAVYANTHHEVAGFFEILHEQSIEAVPVFAANATPGGAVSADAFDELLSRMVKELSSAGRLDGLLLAPHGAGVSEVHRDMDGYWLSRIRELVGAEMPIIVTIDPHANLSSLMVRSSDAIVAYRTNPHLDQRQRGREAAMLLVRTLRGEVKPVQAANFPAITINIERQNTSAAPCKAMYDLADRMLERPRVLSNSIVLGFPYADVPEMGTSFLAVTDNDPALAQQCADELAGYLSLNRDAFVANLIDVHAAIDQALRHEGTTCLLDMGDNVGGGGGGDGAAIARALHERKITAAFVCINDPDAVKLAQRTGVGNGFESDFGGRVETMQGPPLHAYVTVKSLHKGYFTDTRPRHGGRTSYDMGDTAIVVTEHGLTLQLTSHRTMPFSLNQISSCGLDPAVFRILVAKGVQAPVAAYAEVCDQIIRVNTPGVTTADMRSLPYRHRRRPLFPFEH